MKHRILVAYASRYGATREIAEAIAGVLGEHGHEVEVRTAEEVTKMTPYDAVILGSAIYSGNWLPEARELFESFQEELVTRSVWLFSSGPTVTADPVEVMRGWTFPEALAPLAAKVKAEGIALFAGKIDAEKLSAQDWLINRSMRGVVGDFRNWEQIAAWAKRIATILEESRPFSTPTQP